MKIRIELPTQQREILKALMKHEQLGVADIYESMERERPESENPLEVLGNQLRRLRKMGLVEHDREHHVWSLTPKGGEALEKFRQEEVERVDLAKRVHKEVKLVLSDIDEIRDFAERGKLEERLVEFVAPQVANIKEIKTAKLACIYSIFSVLSIRVHGKDIRGRSHVLMLGPLGTAKSEILMDVEQLCPIGIYSVGRGISGAGLTAGQRGSDIVLGALPLSHGGICCIDEIEKVDPHDIGSLHSAMESGYVFYTKVGGKLAIPAECKILAAGNPLNMMYEGPPTMAQIGIDAGLVSRFDWVGWLEEPKGESWAEIANHIVRGLDRGEERLDFIRKYITYAWRLDYSWPKKFAPIMRRVAEEIRGYSTWYPKTPRMIYAAMRLAAARARMRLEEQVTEEDFDHALELIRHTTRPNHIERKKRGLFERLFRRGE